MLASAIGQLLPFAVGVALSPIPIIAVTLMLGTPKARSNGPAFALGWVVGLVAVSTVVLVVTGGASDPDSTTSTAMGWVRVAIGLLFLRLALKQIRKRPKKGEEPEMPKWMATVDEVGPGKALGLGLLLSAANPKNLALTLAAAGAVAQAGLDTVGDVEAVAVFVVLASVTVVGPVLALLVAGDKVSGALAAVKDFMAAHNAVIMFVLLLVLGVKILGDGISVLTG